MLIRSLLTKAFLLAALQRILTLPVLGHRTPSGTAIPFGLEHSWFLRYSFNRGRSWERRGRIWFVAAVLLKGNGFTATGSLSYEMCFPRRKRSLGNGATIHGFIHRFVPVVKR
ncbi:unnamed protein product [Nezara viridula]|uniref:Neuropeptide n=1 Tax=Nezara viridula TaxID=85310 RepID=A0A9P0H3Q3_NEZVI|nr:unnamed protein product [Nezara viridula]